MDGGTECFRGGRFNLDGYVGFFFFFEDEESKSFMSIDDRSISSVLNHSFLRV
jgi:hypothetical protein